MKQGIHPEYMVTKVHCNGCGTEFETHSTVPEITVEICSNCHPFYTGKQKLVDTAGRVDKFNARRAAAQAAKKSKPAKKADPTVTKIENELEEKTVTLEEPATPEEAASEPVSEATAQTEEPVESAPEVSAEGETSEANNDAAQAA